MKRSDWHQIVKVDESTGDGVCSIDGQVQMMKRGMNPDGSQRWRCKEPLRRNYRSRIARPHVFLIEKDVCVRCGFVPENICQLDIDHIDGDHNNNDVTNLQVLCANCHRLKTAIQREYHNIGMRG